MNGNKTINVKTKLISLFDLSIDEINELIRLENLTIINYIPEGQSREESLLVSYIEEV